MAEQAHHELIIVRRHEEEEHEHHSSAWKVAHADFMTAMMAFFLIMWLINATNDEMKHGIANYFNPISLSDSATEKKGLSDPKAAEPSTPDEGGAEASAESSAHVENGPEDERQDGEKAGAAGAAHAAAMPAIGARQVDAAAMRAAEEAAAFQDPYAVLAKLAAEAEPADPVSPDVPLGETGVAGISGGEVHRDPFDPVYWQMTPTGRVRPQKSGSPATAEPVPQAGTPDATAPTPAAEPGFAAAEEPPLMAELRKEPAGETASEKTPDDAAEKAAAESLAEKVRNALAARMGDEPAPNLEIKLTEEGLLVSLTDEADFSMFAVGSAIPDPKVVVAMEAIGTVLKERQGSITIRGYTDGRPFRSESYDNWRLSSARAHMAYYMLTRGGIEEGRISRIEAYADRDLKNVADPNAAENRRIEILLKDVAT